MYYVYKIRLEEGEEYVGCTNNLKRRKEQHNENIRKKKSYLGQYISNKYPEKILIQDDLEQIASFIDRKEALKFESKTIHLLDKKGITLLNDSGTSHSSRKNIIPTHCLKKYILVDFVNHIEEEIYNLSEWCNANGVKKSIIHHSLKPYSVFNNRYKLFHMEDWDGIQDKDKYISGEFLKEKAEKELNRKRTQYSFEWILEDKQGNKIKIKNLNEFARVHNINIGNIHASYTSFKRGIKHRAGGYLVIEKISKEKTK